MNRRRILFIIWPLSALGAFALLFFFLGGPADPVYEGHPLSYWLRQPPHVKTNQLSGMWAFVVPALERIDTNAVPFLLTALDRRDGLVRRTYARAWQASPLWTQKLFPKPVPAAEIRRNAMQYFSAFHELTSPAIVPALVRALETDDDANVRQTAAVLLGTLGRGDPAAVRALTQGLRDNDRTVRTHSTNSLLRINPEVPAKVITNIPPALK